MDSRQVLNGTLASSRYNLPKRKADAFFCLDRMLALKASSIRCWWRAQAYFLSSRYHYANVLNGATFTAENSSRPVVLSFYELTRLSQDTIHMLHDSLRAKLTALGVLGRIYISEEGLNAQVCVPSDQVSALKDVMLDFGIFKHISFNESTASGLKSFDKLKIKMREQVVAIYAEEKQEQCDFLMHKPIDLSPAEFHEALLEASSKPDFLLLDTRNVYETRIGYFKGATFLHTLTFKENMEKMRILLASRDKAAPIYMYCTGGIRCSKAGALLAASGFHNIIMLRGGITAYGHYVKETGIASLFIGKNFTFDNRMVNSLCVFY
jgi:UPF0176 protein